MSANEIIEKLRDPRNWVDGFFTEIEETYYKDLNTIRAALVKEGLWDALDQTMSNWKKLRVLPKTPSDNQKKEKASAGVKTQPARNDK